MTLALETLGPLTLVRFPPAHLALALDGGAGGTSRARTAAEALAASGADAVLDGAMASFCGDDVARIQREDPACSLVCARQRAPCRRLDYAVFDADRGLDVPGRHAADGLTIAVVGDRAVARRGADTPPDARLAAQLYPTLVWDGAAVASDAVNRENVWRAGLAILRDGQLAFVVGHGSMRAFANALVAAGAAHAGYTDGGGSTSLLVRGQARVGHAEDRPVAYFLAAMPSPTTTPEQARGGVPWPAVLAVGGAVVLATGAVVAWRRAAR